jgi:cellobiose-specific phosphotransferase system component IIC
MTWKENLFSNLLATFIMLSLVVIIYCKVTKTTLKELILSIREGLSEPVDYE